MYFVYIIECEDGSLYTGSSTNPEERFQKHKAGIGSKYTRSHKPIRLVYTEQFDTKSGALKKEIQIKSWHRKEKLSLINKQRK